ncbi:hypothetical protein TVAGG3_0328270 [Trichomonas vaginalis G3]|uniref:hypothetical protein n=1 Tax=Trichomonas vaginalis (strain ATCC PRA-98 / G3) TaxID=412133 RepID=UPI0021E59614|nr:hypothetical protein TVAGG3_0328270 [Trichomonas vaginalis G3]KAI5529781.1 hypothetical protein TVAGG3_0328270 [Trichomonas vaginalis G3]
MTSLGIRCLSPRISSIPAKNGNNSRHPKPPQKTKYQREKGNRLLFSSFVWFPDTNCSFPQQVVHSDNLWNHIGKLESPMEILISNRFPVDDIIFANEVILIRAHNGLCAVYKNWSNEFIAYINNSHGELVRSVFFNFKRSDVIFISTFKKDKFSGMRGYAISTRDLIEGKIYERRLLFTTDPIVYPGFVELDNTNGRAVLYFGPGKNYRIFSLYDYSEMFSVSSNDVMDIKMTPNSFMSIKLLSIFKFDLIFYDVTTGICQGDLCLPLIPQADLQFIERSGENILFKQNGNPINCYNIATRETRIIPDTEDASTSEFLFLYNRKLFFVFKSGVFLGYTFNGDKALTVSSERRLSLAPLCVDSNQEYLVCTSKGNGICKVHLFDLSTGKEEFSSTVDDGLLKGFRLTSIAYDKDSHCIVCGDEVGEVHFWL